MDINPSRGLSSIVPPGWISLPLDADGLLVDPFVSSPESQTGGVHAIFTDGSSSNRCQDNPRHTLPNEWPSSEGSRTSTRTRVRSLLGWSLTSSFLRFMPNNDKRRAKRAQRGLEATEVNRPINQSYVI